MLELLLTMVVTKGHSSLAYWMTGEGRDRYMDEVYGANPRLILALPPA